MAPPDPAAGIFESILVLDGRPLRLASHLARMAGSGRDLYRLDLPADLAARVGSAVGSATGRCAARIAFHPGSDAPEIRVALRPLGAHRPPAGLVRQARSPAAWRHKWLDRTELDRAEARARQENPRALPYFCAPDGTVAETSRGNLFARFDGEWWTPPLGDHLLPGITRHRTCDLLAGAGVPVRIDTFPAERLRSADAVFWTSSLSGALAVVAVDGRDLAPPTDFVRWLNAELGVDEPRASTEPVPSPG